MILQSWAHMGSAEEALKKLKIDIGVLSAQLWWREGGGGREREIWIAVKF